MAELVQKRTTGQNARLVMIGASFAFFLFTLIFNLTHSPLWGDEWEELAISTQSLFDGTMYSSIIGTFQPPLYNFIMHFWLIPSQSMLWFRAFNVLLGFISGVFLWRTVRQLTSELTACVTLCALGCCYEWVYCMQECSEYGLMLTCLFVMLNAFVRLCDTLSIGGLIQFVLGCAGAMYSQYGAVFVVLPCIIMLFVVVWRRYGRAALAKLGLVYGIAFVLFAVPLVVFFLLNQLQSMEESSRVTGVTVEMVTGLPLTMGQIVGHFLHLKPEGAWWWIWSVVSVALLCGIGWQLRTQRILSAPWCLMLGLTVAYLLHYALVQLHIYAMVHPDQSYGFFCRYSYFYIPLFCLVFPVLFVRLHDALSSPVGVRLRAYLACTGVACLVLSLSALLGNWHKSYDDEFARVWADHEGWEEITYTLGADSYAGFLTSVSRLEGYDVAWLANSTWEMDENTKLPDAFWVWHDNWDWGFGGYEELKQQLTDRGYKETLYAYHTDPMDVNNYWYLARYELVQ